MNAYVQRTIEDVRKKYANQPEFVQTVEEVLSSLSPVIDKHPEYEKVDDYIRCLCAYGDSRHGAVG